MCVCGYIKINGVYFVLVDPSAVIPLGWTIPTIPRHLPIKGRIATGQGASSHLVSHTGNSWMDQQPESTNRLVLKVSISVKENSTNTVWSSDFAGRPNSYQFGTFHLPTRFFPVRQEGNMFLVRHSNQQFNGFQDSTPVTPPMSFESSWMSKHRFPVNGTHPKKYNPKWKVPAACFWGCVQYFTFTSTLAGQVHSPK